MLGWETGYVWPIHENVVLRPFEPWQSSAMGNPHEPAAAAPPAPRTSRSGGPSLLQRPINVVPPITTRVEPPPYEAVQARISASRTTPMSSGSRHRTVARPRSGSDNSGQRTRPPKWAHKASSVFACLSCVIGVCNVSRFSMLVYIYKGCFIFQYLLLSFMVGIPVLYLQMALGQYLGAGMLDMWFISPIFKGLGFAMLYLYIFLGIYNAIPLSWLFIYFKDSFITLKDSYKWGKCHYIFASNGCLKALNSSAADFYGWSVPSYFHGRVLGRKPGEYQIGELKFEVAFNLCLVWIIVFLCLSRGPKTFGKVVYIFGMLPIALLMMVTMRFGQQWSDGIVEIFSAPWKPVLLDPTAWWLAAKEAFITWGLMGIVALHICSRNKSSANITKNLIAVVITAIAVLITSSFLFACSANVFHKRNLSLALSSYEEESSVKVLNSGAWPQRDNISVTSLLFGVSLGARDQPSHQSGYQVLRLATETFPAALAVEGVRSISSFWSICFYTSMILFGFGQQIVMWFCVVESIIAVNYKVLQAWHTTLTFITCNLAFLLGLPITSNMGIYIVYYLDFCVSSLWWIVLMYFIMLFAILFIRGRPLGTDQLVNVISQNPLRRSKILPFLILMWNISLPLSFLLLTISFLRTSSLVPSSPMGELMDNYHYWQRWAKTLHFCLQIFPICVIVVVAGYKAVQVFMAKKELPLKEKLKLLCCPVVSLPAAYSRHSATSLSQGSTNGAFVEDPPPKYTPPPSYSTATSRMLTKQLEKQLHFDDCSVDMESNSSSSVSVATVGSMERILPLPSRHELQMSPLV